MSSSTVRKSLKTCFVLLWAVLYAGTASTEPEDRADVPWNPKLIMIEGQRRVFKPADWVNGFVGDGTPAEDTDLAIGPGFFAFNLEMYCLDVGAVSPPEGAVYMFAPLRGPYARLIESISLRLMDHPDISQDDVQRLIWGIQCGVNFRDYSPEFRDVVRPLLTRQEIIGLSVDWGDMFERFLPERFRDAVDRFRDLRSRLADVSESFESLEEIAIRFEEAGESGEEERPKVPGPWAYIGDGLYARIYPYHYQLARYEIFKPAPYALERDELGRIIKFESGAVRAEITYAHGPEPETIVSPDGTDAVCVWRIRSLALDTRQPEGNLVLDDAGWILAAGGPATMPPRPDKNGRNRVEGEGPGGRSEFGQNVEALGFEWQAAEARRRRAKSVRDLSDDIRDYAGEVDENALRDMADLSEIKAVLEEAAVRSALVASAVRTGAFGASTAAAAAQRAGEAGGYAASRAAGDSPSARNSSESGLRSLIRSALAKIPVEPKNIKYQPGQPLAGRRG
ncbi:MAG: hypothetical protein JW747_00925 [Candidatus Aminicenantes bacterium]|nr:hypothetical protein [Candidatus Aminicenantes bacterium]